MVGTAEAPADDGDDLQVLFGLVLAITPRAAKKKDELAASRIYRQPGRRLRPAKRHVCKRGRWTREGPGGR